jgi:hypothetical protein
VAQDKSGKIRAIWASYACHCTTMADVPNHICGDWAGFAREYLERDHPGAVAVVTLGCGADADPKPRTGLEFAKQNGNADNHVMWRGPVQAEAAWSAFVKWVAATKGPRLGLETDRDVVIRMKPADVVDGCWIVDADKKATFVAERQRLGNQLSK